MHTVDVEIFGETYPIKAGDDAAYITEIASFVDGKMREVAGSGKVVTTSKIAILAALNIADELFKCRRRPGTKRDDTDRRIQKLVQDLERAIAK